MFQGAPDTVKVNLLFQLHSKKVVNDKQLLSLISEIHSNNRCDLSCYQKAQDLLMLYDLQIISKDRLIDDLGMTRLLGE